MQYFSKNSIEQLDKLFRINLINSVTGIKPANLIGTISEENKTNLAIFSSVFHMGSSPGLIGFVMRPGENTERHTLENIRHSGCYTINHVESSVIQQAHFTSAKFSAEVSEFDVCKLEEEYLYDFPAPFVRKSNLKIAMKYLQSNDIQLNGTSIIIGEIQHIAVAENIVDELGNCDLGVAGSVGVSGLNSYYALDRISMEPYARVDELPDFD